jgi:hypothetical protein
MTRNRDKNGRFVAGHRANETHGARGYADATAHYLASRDRGDVAPEFREVEAEVLAFVAEYGPTSAIALQATRATVAAELLWRFMMQGPRQFEKHANAWRGLSNASVRVWSKLQVSEVGDDLEAARREALEALENQS